MAFPYLQDLVRYLTGLDLPLPIPMFGLSLVIAVMIAVHAMRVELRRLWDGGELQNSAVASPRVTSREQLEDFVTSFGLWMLFTGVAGARLFSILENLPALFADPASVILTRSGFNVIGGLVVATLVGIWLIRRAGLKVRPAMDAAGPAMMLGYALGRIGCQISGDGDWGLTANMAAKPSWLPTWLWAQTYEGNILGETIPAPGVYPTPIWEIAVGLLLFALLWRLRAHPFTKGWLFALYVVLASLERLWIEPLRVNERYGPFDASQAQYLSAIALVVGLVFLVRLSRRRQVRPADAEVAP